MRRALLVAGRYAAVLLQPADEPLDAIPLAIQGVVEAMASVARMLVSAPGDDGADATARQRLAHRRVAVTAVTNELPRTGTWASATGPTYVSSGEERPHEQRLEELASRDDEGHRPAPTLSTQMHLGREPAARAPERFARLAAHRTSGALVGTDDHTVHEVDGPVEATSPVSIALEGSEHPGP